MIDLNTIQFVDRDRCPLCGSVGDEPHISFRDVPIVRCTSCRFLFSKRLMSGEVLTDYYRKFFGSERHRQGQYINANINSWLTNRLLPIKELRSFLDVGTGYGYLVHKLTERYGIRSIGVELSEQEAQYGRSQLGVDIRNGTLAESGLTIGSFDLVSCFEVIEHIPDPPSFINELARYVTPGGHLLVMTDNFESLVAQRLGPGFPKWIPHSHVSHFGPGSLQKLFTDQCIEVVGCLSYTPWELLARLNYSTILGIYPTVENAFNLSSVLASEMHGHYRLFHLRRLANFLWAKLTYRKNLDGALMYVVGRCTK